MATETERFAELMSELKERSGRSYGTLAKRLHSSNSTLHRYCNGAAVPTEFATVERFAKVCGATADELLVLHQRWHRALAERRRETAPTAAPKATDSEDSTGSTGSTDYKAAATEASTAAVAEEAGPGPAGPDEAAPEGGKTPAAVAKPEPRAGRRRRLLVGAAAALAVAVIAGTVVAISTVGGTGHTSHEERHGSVRGASHEGMPLGAAAPGTSYGASSSATPSPSSSPTAAPSASPGKGASSATGADPIAVSVMPDNWGSPCDQWFALDQEPGKVPPPPVRNATAGWAGALRAVPAGHLRLQLTVQGTGSGPTVLNGMYVHVVSAHKAPRWNTYTMGAGCGGELDPASFAVDLDNPSPRPKPVPGKEGERPTTTSDFPYKVSAGDPQVLNVDAFTVGQDVSWYLELAWSSGGHQGTTIIKDNGRPFRTVALNTEQRYWYNANTSAWLPLT
ncbi:helix-turn-helix transcriptional regulator [Streptomyces sp. UNOC14_S4]|uniref:helix-turn-helix domain-containing protein n=1 Tax=Streptomyces sp. UNOC14_S4 TaxID=2872340 RepID=UPI001E571E97|nr:helix-turn-helix transcriptional regulator [Streptomyces sp. UNOC14_S4]MCC3766705.1 helix-turn-helix domain-containing protein [Streptomyces sp. UNOC14_S4]